MKARRRGTEVRKRGREAPETMRRNIDQRSAKLDYQRKDDSDRRGYMDKSNGDARVIMDKCEENGVKDSSEKFRDIEETELWNSNDRTESSYMTFFKGGDRFYDDGHRKRLKYSEDLMNRHARREEAMKRSRQREESERGRGPEIIDPKRTEVASRDMLREQRVLSRGQQSREDQESRGQQSREQKSRKLDRQSHHREQRLRDQSPRDFDPRLINPGLVDHRGIDDRLYAANGNLRGIDPRKYDPRIRESVIVKSKRNLDEQSDEKHRLKKRIPRRNESSNDRTLPEHLQVFRNDDGRPRSARQCSTRIVTPQVNRADGEQNRTKIKFSALDTASHPETTKANRNESGNKIVQAMPSKPRH
ncbi:Hypothetical predicted protein [Paramuricea clavata]|uniref:Uncharacterized protein n=1 Tax=Paramuricea clavata TaxID=317549 RepID=A0A7D9HXA8_PARCT|nr:Hypothetical predicted protein [Paramuricea clavata]